MTIPEEVWVKYIGRLRAVNDTAADQVKKYLQTHDVLSNDGRQAFLDFAYAISTKYGEASAELACEMYDAIVLLSRLNLQAAVPAETASYGDMAKAVNGTLKNGFNIETIAGAISRWVKMAGQDTMLNNAIRDGAEWAWIPHGDTCAFCIALAGNGWQKASKDALKGGHAEHIHSNCDCAYAIRFDPSTEYKGYRPEVYRAQYDAAEGDTPEEKINSMRRAYYEKNKDKINEQKRNAYKRTRELNSSAAEETFVN